MGKYTMRQWHQKRPGWRGFSAYGISHVSGGIGFSPSHSYAPSTHR